MIKLIATPTKQIEMVFQNEAEGDCEIKIREKRQIKRKWVIFEYGRLGGNSNWSDVRRKL
jgi:hypothetical protein